MFAARNLHRHSFRTLSSLLQFNPNKNALLFKGAAPELVSSNVVQPSTSYEGSLSFISLNSHFNGWSRSMSTSKGRSMRSKVERRMQKESGKTLREIRRAKKLKKKLMTDEERLIYNLKRAKKKVALLLQKLKKYELPELPPSVHDPELLTPEQLQAYKKIGFRNKNYVPVGVRGVFGGVVQNMHLHWKFHETVQVCCDNFPKEKIKEMATMIARLSGGIVINIHNVKTIIMFRGRNYRQPKNLIPINTLTKRKALFKARFEQALESQKLNIKKIEQQLRRQGINPEDPVAMASIQRVASTFFNAIDEKNGSPYVCRGDKQLETRPDSHLAISEPPDDSDQEELDKFIAEIEDAADREWAEEEEAEKEELGRIRYWNRENFGGKPRRLETPINNYSDGEANGSRGWKDSFGKRRTSDTDDGNDCDRNSEWNSAGNMSNFESDDGDDDSEEAYDKFKRSRVEKGEQNKIGRSNNSAGFRKSGEASYSRQIAGDSESDDALSDLDNAMWESDADEESDFRSSGVEKGEQDKIGRSNHNAGLRKSGEASYNRQIAEDSESDDALNELDSAMWESDTEEENDLRSSRVEPRHDFRSSSGEEDENQKNNFSSSRVESMHDFRNSSDEEDVNFTIMGKEETVVHGYESDSVGFKASSIEGEKQDRINRGNFKRNAKSKGKMACGDSGSENMFSDSDTEEELGAPRGEYYYRSSGEEDDKSGEDDYHYRLMEGKKHALNHKSKKTPKELDETWDSD